MNEVLAMLATNAAALSAVGAAIAFVWSIVQFVLVRKRDQEHREFEIYHRLIKELVAPDPESKVAWIDRQTAVLFELRRFKRYHEHILRTLLGLREVVERPRLHISPSHGRVGSHGQIHSWRAGLILLLSRQSAAP